MTTNDIHFHANETRDYVEARLDGVEEIRHAEPITDEHGLPFVLREDVQARILRRSGDDLRGGWHLEEATIGVEGERDRVRLTNAHRPAEVTYEAWACSCDEGERDLRAFYEDLEASARERSYMAG